MREIVLSGIYRFDSLVYYVFKGGVYIYMTFMFEDGQMKYLETLFVDSI